MTTVGDGLRAIAICDGSASWGHGREAARVAAVSIQRAVEHAGSLAKVEDIVFAASRRARADFSIAGEDAPAFSVLVALIGPTSVDVAWIGDVYAHVVRGDEIVERADAHVVVDGHARGVTHTLPGDAAWEKDCFLERRSWPLQPGDRFVYAAGAAGGA